jgi:hypothetical protein
LGRIKKSCSTRCGFKTGARARTPIKLSKMTENKYFIDDPKKEGSPKAPFRYVSILVFQN